VELIKILLEKQKQNPSGRAIPNHVLVDGIKPEFAQGFSESIAKFVSLVNRFSTHHVR
jgi:hypothetical protein